MLRAIVFDFDGVIVDSEPAHYAAIRDVAHPLGLRLTYQQYLSDLIGFDDRDAFRHLLELARHTPSPERIVSLKMAKQAAFEALAAGGVPTIPGAMALIQEAIAMQWPIAIASGATLRDIDMILAGLNLRERFGVVVTADDVAASKPHPQTYALAVDRLRAAYPELNLQRHECLAIEDTAAGIASASAAGLRTLALETTSPRDHLARAGRVVKNLEGITLAQLQQWYG